MKPFSAGRNAGWKRSAPSIVVADQARSSVMSALINLLYREYCRARLMEMRKQHLIAIN
jgi:hypothetical protein